MKTSSAHRIARIFMVAIALALVFSGLNPHAARAAVITDSHTVQPQTDAVPRVFVVHSYHPEYIWEMQLNAGITAGLAEAGYSAAQGTVIVEHFWMDTKRQTGDAYFAQIGQQAIDAALAFDPDVIVVLDNNAARLVAAVYPDLAQPIVFAGLNNNPEDIPGLTDHPNLTGVLERAHYTETLDWIAYVFPASHSIQFMADFTETTDAYLPDFEAALKEHEHILYDESEIFTVSTFADWQEKVLWANDHHDALVVGTYSTIRDAEGVVMVGADVMAWTVEHATIPVVPLWEFGVMEGALGGAVISGDTQGHEAGLLVARVLSGEPAGSIAPVTPPRGKLVLNAAAIKRWNVKVPLDLIQISSIYKPE